jgi:hypothetical protein
MASNYIINRSEQFAKSLINSKKAEQIKMCKSELLKLRSEYKVTTLRKNLTQYRKALKSVGINLDKYLKIKKAEQRSIEKAFKSDKYNENKNRIKISDYEGMISKAIELLDSEKINDVAVGLVLLLGRRPSEILKTAKLYNYGKRKDMLFFRGQLKSRGIDKGKIQLYALGGTSKKCKEALKRFRDVAGTNKMTLREVDKRYLTQLQRRTKYHFTNYLGRCTTYDLRKAYGCICSHLYHSDSSPITKTVFLANLMGHNVGDTDAAKSYDKFYI